MHELTLLAPQEQVDALSDALLSLQALSVCTEDADAGTPREQALWGEPGMPMAQAAWQRSTVKSLFADEATSIKAVTVLLAQDWANGIHLQAIEPVPDEDWVRLTQAQFAPVSITADFWVVPSWHEVPAQAKTVIRLDPGLAFGTGTHPTTRMCLKWLAQHASAVAGSTVLDYGCGSGILAIGAALLGAQTVDAVDIDPRAIEATLSNMQTNLPHTATHHHQVFRAGLPDLIADGQNNYALVLANILATPLKSLAPLLHSHLAQPGHLVLSGILNEQAPEVSAAYAKFGLALSITDQEDGWVLMTAKQA